MKTPTQTLQKTPKAWATLVGSTVGAGIFGIPYAVSTIGLLPSLMVLIFLVGMNVILQLMYAELILRTESDHQLPGYAGLYGGRKYKLMTFFIDVVSGYGTMLAFLAGLGTVLFSMTHLFAPPLWSLFIAIPISYITFMGISVFRRFEYALTLFMLTTITLIALYAIPHIDAVNYVAVRLSGNLPHIFSQLILPYSVLFFAISGISSIPIVRKQLTSHEHEIPRTIYIANGIVCAVYIIFALSVVGITGLGTTQIATLGIATVVGPLMGLMGNILALFTMTTSCLVLAMSIKRVYQFDFSRNNAIATALTFGIPISCFILGVRDFLLTIEFVGGIMIGAQCTIIVLTYWKALKHGKRTPEFTFGGQKIVGYGLIAVYLCGAIATLFL